MSLARVSDSPSGIAFLRSTRQPLLYCAAPAHVGLANPHQDGQLFPRLSEPLPAYYHILYRIAVLITQLRQIV
jgi:hypothetical protein